MAYNNLGTYLSDQGEIERAMACFQKSLAINSNYDEAHSNLGYCLAKLGRRTEAEEQLALALRQRPGYPEAQRELEALKGLK